LNERLSVPTCTNVRAAGDRRGCDVDEDQPEAGDGDGTRRAGARRRRSAGDRLGRRREHWEADAAGTGTGSPGVTSKAIDIAAISTRTGPISADFNGLVPGLQAYFKALDARGGVDGRKLVLAYDLDTAGLSTQFDSATHTAIDQDHAFAVAVSSFWFAPTYFVSTCTPTYGYNVNGNWTGAPRHTTRSCRPWRT
jgi:hypothetical protein